MRHKIAMGALGIMVILATAMLGWSQGGPPPGPDPGRGEHQFDGERRGWGDGPHQFEGGGHEGFAGHGERGGRHEFGGGEHLLRMAENPRVRMFLGLTDDQVARLHKIGVDAEKESIQNHADMELRHIELRELLHADNPDHDAIMAKIDEANALRGKMEKQQVETLLSARSVLTPEQIKKVKAFMEGGGPGMGMERDHRMERHDGMGPGHEGHGTGSGGPPPHPPAPPAQ